VVVAVTGQGDVAAQQAVVHSRRRVPALMRDDMSVEYVGYLYIGDGADQREHVVSGSNSFDVYALCRARSSDIARRFLDSCLPERFEIDGQTEIPQSAPIPRITLPSAMDVVEYLEHEPNIEHYLSWGSANDGDPSHALLLFTQDGAMIAGVSLRTYELRSGDAALLEDPAVWLTRMAEAVGARYGYGSSEHVPPLHSGEFITECIEAYPPRLVDGVLVSQ
jgi:hypothetical protein